MKMYVVYDRSTGQVLHTHASYVLGNNEPVATSEEDVLATVPDAGRGVELAVAPVPEGFDVRSRVHALRVDPEAGRVELVPRERPGPERGSGEPAR